MQARQLRRALCALILAGVPLVLAADGEGDSDDDMFGGGEMVAEVGADEQATDLEKAFLTSEEVQIGGRYSFSLTSQWGWSADGFALDSVLDPQIVSQDIDLSASVYLDARPDEAFRVFGKVRASYPFTIGEGRDFSDVVQITELFSDFNLADRLFFRAGKHTINWGVGYFFSPADVLNLTPIDPADPEADREGPVSIKAHLPIGVHNLYLYLIANDVREPLDLALAPKAELVVGGLEVGLGAFLRKDLALRGIATATYNLGDFGFLAEGVVSYGSDKIFLQATDDLVSYPLGVAPYLRADELFVSATAGVQYSNMDAGLFIAAQYLYNGEGYTDAGIIRDNPAAVGALLTAGEISTGDLQRPGVHYAAVSASWRDIGESSFSASVFWISDFDDLSGMITPQLTWDFLDRGSISLSTPISYGDEGDEFSPQGTGFGVSVSARLGGGSF